MKKCALVQGKILYQSKIRWRIVYIVEVTGVHNINPGIKTIESVSRDQRVNHVSGTRLKFVLQSGGCRRILVVSQHNKSAIASLS